MMAIKGTHVKTPVIQLGRNDLYEPRAFKPAKDDTKKSADGKGGSENRPTYKVNMSFAKKGNAKFIEANLKAIEAAKAKSIEDGEWDENDHGRIAFLDADKDKVQESATSKKRILLADKRPELKGKYSLSAKCGESRPPKVYYLDENGVQREMPAPILDYDHGDEEAAAGAERVKRFWDKMVFEGQNAVVTYTYRPWVTTLGQGVSARLDNVLIVGGGTPAGSVAFEEDFSADDLAELVKWRSENVRGYAGHAAEDGDDADVDEETGEIVEEKPKRRAARRRKPEPVVEPDVDDDDDDDDEAFDDDGDYDL